MPDAPLVNVAPPAQDQAAPGLTQQQAKILACFQLGWKIEELAGVCRVQDTQDLTNQPGFPADLPTAQLQRAQRLVQELNALIVLLGISSPAASNGSQGGSSAAALVGALETWASRSADPSPILAAVLSLDNTVVPYLVGQEPDSTFETAYELGKALSLTYWDIEVANQQSSAEAISRSWSMLFASQRIRAIKRHLFLLSSVFSTPDSVGADPKARQIAHAMQVVSSNLEYWRNSLLHLNNITGAAHRHPPSSPPLATPTASSPFVDPVIQGTLVVQPEVFPMLLTALREQQAIWYDVLTGQRSVESMCPTSILLSLTEDMMGHTWRRLKHFLPLIAGLFITIGIFGVLVAVGVAVLSRPLGGNASAWTAVLTVLGGGATYVATVGAAVFRRGRGAAREVETRTQEVVSSAQQVTQQVTQATGSVGARAATLVHDGLDGVIEQIKQEEYTVMASQPLVLFVLRRANQETGDPLQDAIAFLRLVYQGRSNLERLLAIFPEMYLGSALAG